MLQNTLKKEGIKFVEIKGSIKSTEREKAVKDYNKGKVNVFFLSKAGGQGLDLKGTRKVIIFEGVWNKATEEQVRGRAIRYKSHTHLPKQEQFVDVYHILLRKPKVRDFQYKFDYKGSADELLYELSSKKDVANRTFMSLLHSVSINAPPKTICPPVHYIKQSLQLVLAPESPSEKKYNDDIPVVIMITRKGFDPRVLPYMSKLNSEILKMLPGAKMVYDPFHGHTEITGVPKSVAKAVMKKALMEVQPKAVGVMIEWLDEETLHVRNAP